MTEHGDGFGLTFVDPDESDEMRGLVTMSVPVASGFDILVADEATIAQNFAMSAPSAGPKRSSRGV